MYTPYSIAPGMWNIVHKDTGEIIDAGPFHRLEEVEREAQFRYYYDTLQLAIARRGLLDPHPQSARAYRELIKLPPEKLKAVYEIYEKVPSKEPNVLHHAAVKAVLAQ